MAYKTFCNQCDAELPPDRPHYALMNMGPLPEPPATPPMSAHFCSLSCLRAWADDRDERPDIRRLMDAS